jgi:Transcriptional regulators of sugar metabolism
VLVIDAGSTTLHFARRLAAELRDLTVVTNSFAVAMALRKSPHRGDLLPGQYDAHEGSVTGPDTIAFLNRFNANRAVIGASGITGEGPNEVNSGAAAVKRAMLLRAEERMLLVDHSKFGMPHLEVVCPLSDIHRLVTDRPPARELAAASPRQCRGALLEPALPSAAPRADNGPGARRSGAGSSVGTSPSAKRDHDIPVLAGQAGPTQREASMSVARVTKLTASSPRDSRMRSRPPWPAPPRRCAASRGSRFCPRRPRWRKARSPSIASPWR